MRGLYIPERHAMEQRKAYDELSKEDRELLRILRNYKPKKKTMTEQDKRNAEADAFIFEQSY